MADEMKYEEHAIKPNETCADPPLESTDRGVFDFMKSKKDEENKPSCEEDKIIASEFEEKVQVCDDKENIKEEHKVEEKKHEGLLEKLHRTSSSSSSSSDEEEVDENGEKKKKKKGLKEKIKDKISGDKKEGEEKPCDEDTSVPVEKYEDVPPTYDHHQPEAEEKKGFLDKIKDKLPGGSKKAEEVAAPPPPHAVECATTSPAEAHHEGKEKKGFLDKIKEKIPGFKGDDEKEKEKEKEGAC